MGPTTGEKGVIKLVHPGRYVEIHTKPITAAEILKRNPRHSVTRPDVFEYPWIVVRPESLLHLGRVYYVVPNRTIYKLIKAKGYNIQPSLQKRLSPKYEHRHVHLHEVEQSSPSKLSAGLTPKHKGHCQAEWQQFQASPPEESCGGESFSFDRPSQYESIADIMTEYQSTYHQFKLMSMTDYMSDHESPESNGYEVSCSKAAASEDVTILKSCLRRPDSARRLLDLKVTFSLPTNGEERRRIAIESRAPSLLYFTG